MSVCDINMWKKAVVKHSGDDAGTSPDRENACKVVQKMEYNWILASASPRRREILSKLISPDRLRVMVSDAEEHFTSDRPEEIVKELAELKGRSVLKHICGLKTPGFKGAKRQEHAPIVQHNISMQECADIVIAADTLVFVGNEILGKPKNREDAHRMISLISGREHHVCTGVFCGVKKGSQESDIVTDVFSVTSTVIVDKLSEEEIQAYIDSPEPYDKAGGYAIQGLFGKHIKGIVGDYYNIVGFPLNEFYGLCKRRGYL